jgi:oligopeptide transport system ATP-binding protein
MKFICDRIAVVHKGLIVELADADTLFRHPLHPYTRALLSAIPQPNPDAEKHKVLEIYDPTAHHYQNDPPAMVEIEPGHLLFCNRAEMDAAHERLAKGES